MGAIHGGTLVDDWVSTQQGYLGGYRLGWDYAPNWGCELRYGFASLELHDSARAQQAQVAADLAQGLSADDPYLDRFDHRRDGDLRLWDIDLLWYPWGETRCRPYLMAGLGTARIEYLDRLSRYYAETAFQIPVAIGAKYLVRDWFAVRMELADNFVFGSGSHLESHSNVSFTVGMEVRFGGPRTGYWPYNPSRQYW